MLLRKELLDLDDYFFGADKNAGGSKGVHEIGGYEPENYQWKNKNREPRKKMNLTTQ